MLVIVSTPVTTAAGGMVKNRVQAPGSRYANAPDHADASRKGDAGVMLLCHTALPNASAAAAAVAAIASFGIPHAFPKSAADAASTRPA